MDLTKTGKIYDLERFKSPLRRKITTRSSVNDQEKSLLMEKTAAIGDVFETRSRFEQVFLASPRAQELYSSLEKTKQRPTPQKSAPLKLVPNVQRPTPHKSPTDKNVTGMQRLTPQKSTTSKSVPGFDEVVNMANFFHNKTSHSASAHSALSDHSLTFGKPRAFSDLFNEKDFEVSPFKRSVNDSAIKQKVNMAISRLEDDSHSPLSTSLNKTKTNAPMHAVSRDSGFNDVQSDSGGSSEGAFTDVMNRRSKETSVKEGGISTSASEVNTAVRVQNVNKEEEVHISFESNSSDEEIDVVTDGEQIKDGVDEDNDNLTTKNTELSAEQAEGVVKTRSKEAQKHANPETKRTSKVEHSHSSTSSDKPTQQTSKINSLKQWSIKALKTRTHMGIIVEGQRSVDPVGELWHSTAIVTRLNSRCVQTKSGSQYKLIGPINEGVTLQQGFPAAFVKAFKNGFPENWLSLVADYFNSQGSSESEDEKTVEEQPEKKKGKVAKGGKNTTAATHTPTESKTKKKNNKTADFKTPENRALPKEIEVKTTRSGRMVKPPLAWWRGQRILTDREHNLEGIDPGGVEHTPLSSMYNVEIKLPTKREESSPFKQKKATSGSESSDSFPKKQREKTKPSTKASNRIVSSDSSSERDTDESVRKPLFVSPKKIPNKNESLQKSSPKAQAAREEKGASVNKSQGNSVTKSSRNNDLTQGLSARKCPPHDQWVPGEDELPAQVNVEEEITSAHSLGEEIRSRTRRKNYEKPCTDSESEVEQIAPKIPSPPRRVLRSRGTKAVSRVSSDTDKLSELDSEDSQADRQPVDSRRQTRSRRGMNTASDNESRLSSCDERLDNAGDSGKAPKTAASKTKNLEKRLVHKRINELAKETSTQSSDDDSDGTSNKQSKKKQVHPRSSKAAKENTEAQSASENEKKVGKGSSKRKPKAESDSERASAKKQALKVFKQTANKNSKKRKDEMSDEAVWTEEEIQKLNKALYTIPGNTPMFWQKVSREVGSRTAEECQFQHQGQVLVSNKKEPLVQKSSAKAKKDPGQKAASQQSVKTVTGGVGTIKRKRELRELLEQQDVDYEDDIFDSTPFKKKKDLKLPFNLSSQSSEEEEDDDDDDESEAEHSATYKTPSSRTPSSRFRPLGPLSMSATPGAEFVSPSLLQQVNRKDMDHYIYRMQQGKRGTQVLGKQKSKPMRTSTPKKTSSNSGLPALSSELFEAHPASDHESGEEDQDYYFSDE